MSKRSIRIKKARRIRVSNVTGKMLMPFVELPTEKGTESMSGNRDAMHAAGGSLIAAQLANQGVISHVEADKIANNVASTKPSTPQNRGPRAVLNLKEDYDLTAWLHGREPKWGESPKEIADQAAAQFPAMTKLNVDHIKTRLEAFAEALPKAKPPVVELTVIERIERLEDLMTHFSAWMVHGEGLNSDTVGGDALRVFLASRGL